VPQQRGLRRKSIMKIATFHYDDGKAKAMVKTDDFEGQTGSTEKYDMYVETLDSDSGILDALKKWMEDNLIIKTEKQKAKTLRALFTLKVVDISNFI
jgi:hypothetical protein